MTPSTAAIEAVKTIEIVDEQPFIEGGMLTISRLPAQNADTPALAWRHMRPLAGNAGNAHAPLIYLVHGAAHSGSCWLQTQRELVRRGIESVAVDLRGHGFSRWNERNAKRTQATRYADYLDDIGRVRAIGLPADRPLILVGHSQGSILAQLHVEAFPAAALVLVASPTADMYLSIVQAGVLRLLFSRDGFGMVHGLFTDLSRLFASRGRIRRLLVGQKAPRDLVEQLYVELKDTHETKYGFVDIKAASARGRVPLKTALLHLIVGTNDTFYPALAPLQHCAAANGATLACIVGPHDLMLAGDTQSFVDQLIKVHAQADARLRAAGIQVTDASAPAGRMDLPFDAEMHPVSSDAPREAEALPSAVRA